MENTQIKEENTQIKEENTQIKEENTQIRKKMSEIETALWVANSTSSILIQQINNLRHLCAHFAVIIFSEVIIVISSGNHEF